mmetsp:Transcript_18100/g.46686  ORF Transcript_18100/g.46686 Transcript_18100/m.46686 type:complete len:723 (+) Transcript_18100:1493-3661(+)
MAPRLRRRRRRWPPKAPRRRTRARRRKKKDEADDGTGKKKKKEKKQKASAMMEEALGNDEAAQEVAVEEADDEESELAKAVAKLNALLESSGTEKELEAAIKLAHGAGADDKDLQAAALRIKELRSIAKAKERLRTALDDLDMPKLRKAITKAEEAGVPKSDIKEAKKVLAVEEPKALVREQLRVAQDAGDAAALKVAVQEAKRIGIESEELVEFEKLLAGAESKEKAEAALKGAIEERDIHKLKFAIQQAKDAGVEKDQIKQAKAVLKEEEPKQAARELLEKAMESCAIAALKEAIAAAEAAPLEAKEYKPAVKLLKQEEEKERLLGAVKQALADAKTVDTSSIDALRAAKESLSEAIQVAIKSGVPEAHIADAEMRRKKLHNAIEDLKGSIRVFCRIRPLSGKERESGDTEVTKKTSLMSLQVDNPNMDQGVQTFNFDSVFTPGTQEEVFEDCRDLVQSAVDGYNVTIFAYGQTGAGKTFTMYGAKGMEGTTPRTIQEIYRLTEQGSGRFDYTVTGSMLELYRNDLIDLLCKGKEGANKKLNIRQEKSGMVMVEGLSEEVCPSAAELTNLLERGNDQRTVAATAMNSESSRSHLVFIIRVISVNRETKEQLRGKMLIVDLAGSERLKKSQVSEDMQKEAIEINKSLTALGDVIEALTKGNKVCPYRNHKLTQLMQDSLGGSAKTLMFVNCSPANTNTDETVMSLKYATRAKTITNTGKKS